jgi:hypothetical protein
MSTHSDSIDRFVDEVRRDPQFAEFADQFHTHLTDIDRLGDDSPDHAEFLDGLKWIWEQPRPVGERLGKMIKFTGLEGNPVVCDLPEFTGWR